MRLFILLCASLAALVAHGQAQPAASNLAAHVSFEQPATPLSRLMPQLAELTKLPLKVTKGMETEVVLIAVHDVSVEELMRRIAAATGGKWGMSDNTYYLSPSDTVRQALQRRAFAARAAKLVGDIKELDPATKPSGSKPDPTSNDFTMNGMMGSSGDPVFFKLLSAIGPQQLASMLPGDRAVLSTRPLARQFALPDCTDILAQYVHRRNTEAAQAEAKMKQDANGDTGDVTSRSDGAPFGPVQRINGRVDKALLILNRTQGMGAFMGNGELTGDLVLYDGAGKELGRDHASVGSFFDRAEMQEMMTQASGKATPTPDAKLELSADTKKFSQYLHVMQADNGINGKGGMTAALRSEMTDRFMHPEVHDPLAYPADLIRAYAKSKNLQVVASVPDSFAVWLISLMMTSTTAASIESKLAHDTSLVVDNADGWLTVSPGDFRSEPMDRTDLRNILVSLSRDRDPSIELLAAAAVAGFGDPTHGMLPEMWLALIRPSLATLFTEDWDMLRFYGTLSADQRGRLLASKRLAMIALTEPQKTLLDHMIYGGSSSFSFSSSDAPLHVDVKRDQGSVLGEANSMFSDELQQYGVDGESSQDYRGEPTEAAPNGLPAGAMITLNISSVQVLEPDVKTRASTTAAYYNQPMGIDQLASMVAMRESPQFAQMSSYIPVFDHVKVGTKRSLHFRIYVSAESFKASTLSDCSFPEGASYALNALPGPLQKKFDDVLKQMREAYKDAPADGGDDGPPAPP
ncbi:MAG: hypothetical protein ACYC96_07460 [Fimbriimonadaceae bacterium]